MSKYLNTKIVKVTVVKNKYSTDTICISTLLPTAFPEMGYETTIQIIARADYGEEWVRSVLGVEPEIVESRA